MVIIYSLKLKIVNSLHRLVNNYVRIGVIEIQYTHQVYGKIRCISFLGRAVELKALPIASLRAIYKTAIKKTAKKRLIL